MLVKWKIITLQNEVIDIDIRCTGDRFSHYPWSQTCNKINIFSTVTLLQALYGIYIHNIYRTLLFPSDKAAILVRTRAREGGTKHVEGMGMCQS